MSNCDWNRPCDCSDCIEIGKVYVCPKCNFKNYVIIDRDSHWVGGSPKGGGYYEFTIPTSPIKNLGCRGCGYLIMDVGYYTSVNEEACSEEKSRQELRSLGRYCSKCDEVEGGLTSSGKITLREYKEHLFCEQKCLKEVAIEDIPKPVNKGIKYRFDLSGLRWVEHRVRLICSSCSKPHWVYSYEKHWRHGCKECYKIKKGRVVINLKESQ